MEVQVEVKLEEQHYNNDEEDDETEYCNKDKEEQDNNININTNMTLVYHQQQYQQHLQERYQQSLQENEDNNSNSNYNNKKCKERPKYSCPRDGCDAVFTRPYRLMGHIRVHDGIKDFKCLVPDCDKSYTNKSHLVRHMRNVHCGFPKIEEYECEYCNLVCSNKQNLKKHIQRKHEATFAFKCDVCDMGFSRKNMYLAHNYLHTGVMAFECDKCDRSFVTATELNKHIYNHKEYKCAECEAVYHNFSQLVRHRKETHTAKVELKCDMCQKIFRSRPNIARHMKTHHDPNFEKVVFGCPYDGCPKFYSSKSNLMCHINSFHHHETFGCYVCDAQLSTEQKLRQHIEKHYREVLPKKEKKAPCKRKDTGAFKRSTAIKLSQVQVPLKVEKKIAQREEISLDAVVLSCQDKESEPENPASKNIECIL